METARKQPTASGASFRLLCLMAKAALNTEPTASLADIVEAVKVTAARARIPYDQVRPAIEAVIASGTTAWRGSTVQSDAEPVPDHHGFSHQEAAALLDKIKAWGTGPVASATAVPIAGTGPRGSVDAPASGAAGGSRVPHCGDD